VRARNHAILEVTPQRNEAIAAPTQRCRCGACAAPAGEASVGTTAERALRLEAQPQPGDLDHHGPHPAVTRLADALVALAVSAVVGVLTKPQERHFTRLSKAPPAEELHHQQPGAWSARLPQAHQLHDAALASVFGFRSRSRRSVQARRSGAHQRKALELAFKLAAQLPGQRAPVPQGERLSRSFAAPVLLTRMPCTTSND